MKKLTLALTVAVSLLTAVHVRAQAPTVITSLPYTITAKGNYVLNDDLGSSQTTGTLILINASNVTLDLQGHYISGPAGVANTINAIYAYERSNLTVRNGTIANCYRSLCIDGNGSTTTNNRNHSFDNLRMTRDIKEAVFIRNAPATTVTNSKISQIGDTNTDGTNGINIVGAGVTVQSCVVSGVVGKSGAVGIYLDTGSFARENTISNCNIGIDSGKYQDNLTANCNNAFLGGVNAGGNN